MYLEMVRGYWMEHGLISTQVFVLNNKQEKEKKKKERNNPQVSITLITFTFGGQHHNHCTKLLPHGTYIHTYVHNVHASTLSGRLLK